MKLTQCLFAGLLLCANVLAGTPEGFKKDFGMALAKEFSNAQLNRMFRKYNVVLTPWSGVTRLSARLKGEKISRHPLAGFRQSALYRKHIAGLLDSPNENHRILAYMIIASAGDKSFEAKLLQKLQTEKHKAGEIRAGIALLYLQSKQTTPLFDFIVKRENFHDAHMLPMLFRLDKEALQKTAYLRIGSKNRVARILAAQLLSVTGNNEKTARLLKQAVRNWDLKVKGYAIYSLKKLGVGKLLSTLQPLLKHRQTRAISLQALANSPTVADRKYLYDLIGKQKVVSTDLLNALYSSSKHDNLKFWLKMLSSGRVPKKYVFFVFKQPLLRKDVLLADLQQALVKIRNPEILNELVRALKGRRDNKSLDIMLGLLKHDDSTVRYWAATSLSGSRSTRLQAVLSGLIRNRKYRTVALTKLAITNRIESLHGAYESIYKQDAGRDWKRSAIEYLSTFPRARHKKLFRRILQGSKADSFIKRNAALGLGRLRDRQSVGLIIKACRKESKSSDYNARIYLYALAMIKGDRAKTAIRRYTGSSDRGTKSLARRLLRDWNKKQERLPAR